MLNTQTALTDDGTESFPTNDRINIPLLNSIQFTVTLTRNCNFLFMHVKSTKFIFTTALRNDGNDWNLQWFWVRVLHISGGL